MKKLLPLLVLALSLFGCTNTTRPYLGSPVLERPLREREPVTVRVGTARVDITPPPTAASFGHAPDGHLMEGVWTRLYCRVFVFETGDQLEDSIAFVPCELGAPSNILQRTIVEEVHKLKDPKDPRQAHLDQLFPASRIMLTATHTHAAPAHYLESPAYGGATSSRFPGFDPKMVDFFAKGIARGIVHAYLNRAAARLRWAHDDVWDLTRNRSIDAYRMNTVHPYAPAAPDPSAPDEYRAIDPALDVLQIETADGARTMGWMVFFAMHPTVLPAQNRLFGGDAFGVASRALERELRRTLVHDAARCAPGAPIDACPTESADPLVALIQTNEGDISPRYTMPTVEETLRVGGALADHAIVAVRKTGDAPFHDHVAFDARYVEIEMEKLIGKEGLCEPVLGQAAMRGAADHRATVDGMLEDASSSDRTDPCAPKRKALGYLQNVIVPSQGFPKHVALAVVRLDTTLISFVPAELTITAGHLLDDVVRRAGPAANRWLVAGLANAYLQYVTTGEEYQLQAYEGGSNLYGPHTLDVFARRLHVLARMLKGEASDDDPCKIMPVLNPVDAVAKVRFDTAAQVSRFANPSFTVSLQELGDRRKNRVLCRLPGRKPVALCDIWQDGGPGRIAMTSEPWLAIVTERGTAARLCGAPFGKERLAATCDPGATLDDRGTSFRTHTNGESCCGDAWMWSSLVTPTESDWEALATQGKLRFVAHGGKDGADVFSPAFSAAEPPPVCDDEQTRYCLAEAPTECLSTSCP